MKIWRKLDLEKALKQTINVDQEHFGKIEFNSNNIKKHDIFIALKEGKGDGHKYVNDAFKQGASLAIVEKPTQENQSRQIVVESTIDALYQLAEYKRKYTKAKIIAITGSLGKTSCKEMLSEVLSKTYKVFSSYKNFNNYIGLPLNLASMPEEIDYAVFEIGMNHANEIRPLVKILNPYIALITSIAPVHIENFDSLKGIADAKLEIFDYIDQKKGFAIIPRDSEYFSYMFQILKGKGIENLTSFGFEDTSTVKYKNYTQSFENADFDIEISNQEYHCKTPMIGRHHASNITGIVSIISLLNIDIEKSLLSLADINPVEGRGNRIEIDLDNRKLVIINDAYNASPESVKASLENYKYLNSHNKALILGDMKELGDNSILYHEELVEHVKESGIKTFISVGNLMKHLYNKVKSNIESFHFDDVDSCKLQIKQILADSDHVLIKGSNGMKLYEIVEYLKNFR